MASGISESDPTEFGFGRRQVDLFSPLNDECDQMDPPLLVVNRCGGGDGGGDDDDGGGDGGEDGQDDDDNDVCDQMGVGLLALLAISCASVETLPESLLPASVTSVPPVPVLVPVSVRGGRYGIFKKN